MSGSAFLTMDGNGRLNICAMERLRTLRHFFAISFAMKRFPDSGARRTCSKALPVKTGYRNSLENMKYSEKSKCSVSFRLAGARKRSMRPELETPGVIVSVAL